MSVSIKPLEDRILVQTLEAEQTTASGLVIPDTAKEKPQEGKVLAVGPGRFDEDGDKRIPLDIKVNDVVIHSKYGHRSEVRRPRVLAAVCSRRACNRREVNLRSNFSRLLLDCLVSPANPFGAAGLISIKDSTNHFPLAN